MSQLRVNTYAILDRAVEEGIAYGWRRAHKHDDKPNEFAIQEHIRDEIMNAVCEVFIFNYDDEVQEGDHDALRSQSEGEGESGEVEGKGESKENEYDYFEEFHKFELGYPYRSSKDKGSGVESE